MKRVCIVRQNYYPDEAHIRRDAETLVDQGYKVDIICLKRKGQIDEESDQSVNIHRIPLERHRTGIIRYLFEYALFTILSLCKLSWLSVTRKYDIIEVVAPPDFLVLTTIVPRLRGAKVILYTFDPMPDLYAQKYRLHSDHILIKLLRAVERTSMAWAHHVIAPTEFVRQLLISRGVPQSKISVVLNVPDEKIFSQQSQSIQVEDRFRIVSHGSILEQYGIQTLIRAVPLLVGEIPTLEVMIVGDGEYRTQLENLVKTLAVGDYVNFTGLVPFEDVPHLIAQSHLGVVPALMPMIPNKLFEYLAIGRPALVARNPAVENFFDDESLMLFEPDDEKDLAECVLKLYRNPYLREALAASASAIYEKYKWSRTKYRYLEVFEKLIKDGQLHVAAS